MVVLARLIDCVFQNDAAVVTVGSTLLLVVVAVENRLKFDFAVKLEKKTYHGKSSAVVAAVDW